MAERTAGLARWGMEEAVLCCESAKKWCDAAAAPAALRFGIGPNVVGAHAPGNGSNAPEWENRLGSPIQPVNAATPRVGGPPFTSRADAMQRYAWPGDAGASLLATPCSARAPQLPEPVSS